MIAVSATHPLMLAFAGVMFIIAAAPWHLRARGVRGTWAIRPEWLVGIGVSLLLAAFAVASWPS